MACYRVTFTFTFTLKKVIIFLDVGWWERVQTGKRSVILFSSYFGTKLLCSLEIICFAIYEMFLFIRGFKRNSVKMLERRRFKPAGL